MDAPIGCALILVFIGCIVGIGIAIVHDAQKEEAERVLFMSQCEKVHKEFECTAMWRVGEKKDDTVVVPMPIYIPSR